MRRIWLFAEVFLWSCILCFLLMLYDPQRIIKIIDTKKQRLGKPGEKRQIIRCIHSVCKRNPFVHRRHCLHRSLLLYRFLRRIGYSPAFNIGFTIKCFLQQEGRCIDRVHAWVTVNGEVILDDMRNCTELYPYFLWMVSNIRYWASIEKQMGI